MTCTRLLLLWAGCGLVSVCGGGAVDVRAADQLVLEECLVKVRDEVRVPAPEQGVLMQFPVREGSRVAKGDVLAVIDDRESQAALKIAQYGLEAAAKRATDMVEEKYARKASEVAEVDWKKALQANERKKDAVPEMEILQKKLAFERAELQIEKAQKDRQLARLDARTKLAERDAAQLAVDWRTITASFPGEVVTTYRHEGEWVNPGDPILLLVRFDELYVEAYADANQYDRSEVLGRPVSVELHRARGNKFSVPGSIVYVEQEVQSDGRFKVRAQVTNALEGKNWLIQPGMRATMTIPLGDSSQEELSENVSATK